MKNIPVFMIQQSMAKTLRNIADMLSDEAVATAYEEDEDE